METQFITRMTPVTFPLSEGKAAEKSGMGIDTTFRSIFENAIADVEETAMNLQQQRYRLATGQIDDPHTVQIAASEAQLSINMLVQLRNKALDAYNELMRINL